MISTTETLDVMQVCRNGHVITQRLHGDPESGRTHCDRCGATTLDHCLTCGEVLTGAGRVPDLVTIGSSAAPRYCARCGVAFPWVRRPRPAPEPLAQLENLLRRLPLVVRQLRWRQTDRPPLRVEDERDLEDLVRALLPLHFDDVRPESRTPRYSAGTRTDFLLSGGRTALTSKYVRAGRGVPQLAEEWREDVAYYQQRGGCRVVVHFVYDPEGLLPAQAQLASITDEMGGNLELHCIAAG